MTARGINQSIKLSMSRARRHKAAAARHLDATMRYGYIGAEAEANAQCAATETSWVREFVATARALNKRLIVVAE